MKILNILLLFNAGSSLKKNILIQINVTITRKNDTKKTGWGFGGMLAAGKSATDDFGNLFSKGKKDADKLAPQASALSIFSTSTQATSQIDDQSDMEAIKEINKKLKEANKSLQKSMADAEKNYRKESVFNQKLIVKLSSSGDFNA